MSDVDSAEYERLCEESSARMQEAIKRLDYREPMVLDTRLDSYVPIPQSELDGWDDLTVLTYAAGFPLANSGIKVLIAAWNPDPTCQYSVTNYANKIEGVPEWPIQVNSFQETQVFLDGLTQGAYIESKKHTKESS